MLLTGWGIPLCRDDHGHCSIVPEHRPLPGQQRKLVGQQPVGQHILPGGQQLPLQQMKPLSQQSAPSEPVQHVWPDMQQMSAQQVSKVGQQCPSEH
jgi:hypothetical protein